MSAWVKMQTGAHGQQVPLDRLTPAIHKLHAEFTERSGHPPTALYVGRVERGVLRWMATEYKSYELPAPSDGPRAKWEGLAIYVVDAEEYLAVG